jgi:glutamine amidotransferase
MHKLKSLQLDDVLTFSAIQLKKPVLGICLGMQLMTSHSAEGDCAGLKWIDARVEKISVSDSVHFKIPHTGWNSLHIKKLNPVLNGISDDELFYFVHSYKVNCFDSADILATTTYENEFVSAFSRENIIGVQFHPEKSHDSGIQLMSNFIKLACSDQD